MGFFSNRIDRDELQAGDHIYSWRTAFTYAHHGIYLGDTKVVHFTRGRGQEAGTGTFLDQIFDGSRPPLTFDCSFDECNSHKGKPGVSLCCLDCFLRDGDLYRFRYGVDTATFLAKARGGTCTIAPADDTEIVLHRVLYLLENGFGGYDIFRNNCEDFSMYCKTGLLVLDGKAPGRSGQAVSLLFGPFAAVFSSPLGLAVTASVYCLSRYAIDLGVRTDVVKVPVEELAINLGWSKPESEITQTPLIVLDD